MTTVASIRNSQFETTCKKCGEPLIAPEWSEFVSEGLILNLWSCTKCGCRFETEVCMPADAEAKDDDESIKAFFPSLLVA
jgi:predicted nucleic-acid-binding Zn-ribbon protein